jgi:hypothetical protein
MSLHRKPLVVVVGCCPSHIMRGLLRGLDQEGRYLICTVLRIESTVFYPNEHTMGV